MNARFLIVGSIVGGIVLFLWGAVTHMLLPWPVKEFKDDAAVVEAVRANAPANGIYLSTRGVFASVAFTGDAANKTQSMGPYLAVQFVTDTISAFLLCLLAAWIPCHCVWTRASRLFVAGLAAFTLKILPYWNWYGFSTGFVAMEALDMLGKFFIGGLVLGALMKKLSPRSVVAPAAVS